MLYGAIIDGVNTLTRYGLFLGADIEIGEPARKDSTVNVPGADGVLDMSDAPQGYPVYNNRTISFTLLKRSTSADELDALRTDLRDLYHGKKVTLILPTDPDYYFEGVISIGKLGGYDAPYIPVTMSAYPYKIKLTETTVTVTGNATVVLHNARMSVVPRVANTAAAVIRWNSQSAAITPWDYPDADIAITQLESGDPTTVILKLTWLDVETDLDAASGQVISGFVLGMGDTTVNVESSGTTTFTYREGRL